MKYLLLLLLLLLPASLSAQNYYAGYCQDGGQTVTTSGATSTTKVQRSYPSCTVTIFISGTTTITPITSDGVLTKANPFTAATNGYWFFYSTRPIVDIRFSGGGITTPYTQTFTSGGSGGSGGSSGNIPSAGGIGSIGLFQIPLTGTTGQQFNVWDAVPGSSPCAFGLNLGAIATWSGSQWNCSAVAASISLDTSLKSLFNVFLAGGNVTTSTFTNPTVGKLITVVVKQDSVGGRTFAWPTNAVNAPAIPSAARLSVSASFYYDGTNWQFIVLPQSSSNLISAATLGNKIVIANAFPSTFGDEGSRIVNADYACGTLPCIIYHFGGGKITQEVVVRSNHRLILSGGTYPTLSLGTPPRVDAVGDIANPWTQQITFGTEQVTGVPFILQDDSSLECTGWDTIIQESTVAGQWVIVKDFAALTTANQGQSNRIRVTGCHFQGANPAFDSASQNISLGNCHGCRIDHNSFQAMHAIATQFGSGSAGGKFAQDFWINDNLFENCVSQNMAVVNGNDGHIVHNTVFRPGIQDVLLTQPGSTMIDLETNVFSDQMNSIEIANNILDNTGNIVGINQAIAVQCGGGNCHNIVVTGNVIKGQIMPDENGGSAPPHVPGGGILVQFTADVMVSNNTLLYTAYGIGLNQATRGSVMGNRLIYSPGIGLQDSFGVFVSSNTSYRDTQNPGTSVQNFLSESNTSDFNTFANNIGFAGSPQIVGAHSVVVNNFDPACINYPNCVGDPLNVTTSTVTVSAFGFANNSKGITGTYTLLPTDGLVLANSTGGSFTVTLPKITFATPGRIYTIKVSAGTNLVTLVCDNSNGAQTIDGAASYVGLTTANKYVTVQYGLAGSSTWFIIGNN